MNLLWNENLSTGVESIDSQHKELLIYLDNFLSAMRSGKGKSEIQKTLDFLESYVIEHFKEEEDIQRKYGYPKSNEQCAQHAQFINELKQLRIAFEKTGESVLLALNVQSKLVDWVKNHILTLDKDLGQFIIEKTK